MTPSPTISSNISASSAPRDMSSAMIRPRSMHGKTSLGNPNRQDIFKGIPSLFEAMRYHSLVVYDPVPAELEVTATTAEGEIMALRHRQHQTFGVQFHPESILTEHGKQILKNFLEL